MTDRREQELLNRIAALEKENASLLARVNILQQARFAPKTERRIDSRPDDSYPSLFNEAETEAKPTVKEPEIEKTPVKGYERKRKGKSSSVKNLLESLPADCIENIDIDLDADKKVCEICGHNLSPIGKILLYRQIEFVPARLICKCYYQMAYECRNCRKNDQPHIIKPSMPKPPIPHSFASPSAIAHVMMQKYGLAVPLNRQEREWKQLGLPLNRATLANWIIISSNEYLKHLCDYMHGLLLKEPCLHADETPVQVLNEKGRKNTSKSYMWVFTSGEFAPLHNIRLFQYSPTRKGTNASEFLKGFSGYLQTDDYSGYNQVTGITRCLCWAHARRKYIEAETANQDESSVSLAAVGLRYIRKLFKIEEKLHDLIPEERKAQRIKQEKPVLEAYWQWAESSRDKVLPKSKISQALNYSLTNKKQLEAYLQDGRCAISNNIAENSIRPFTVGRKNWLFSASPKGAEASACVYSIIETCKANNIDPEKYLIYLFTRMPNEERLKGEAVLEKYMPWNPEVQKSCK